MDDVIQSWVCRRVETEHFVSDCGISNNGEQLTKVDQGEDSGMEEDMTMAVTEQGEGDAFTDEGESSGDMADKRGRKKSVGSKKLQVSVTDVNLLNPRISNGVSLQDNSVKTRRGRGRPKGSKNIIDDNTPKKRGRPKCSTNKSPSVKGDVGDLSNDSLLKKPRGRPKSTTKRKLDSTSGDESDGSSVPPRKRGRPKGSPNKKPKLRTEVESENEVETTLDKPKKGRGRPRKNEGGHSESVQVKSKGKFRKQGRPKKPVAEGEKQERIKDGLQPEKRGRGRPKGSPNKLFFRVESASGRPARPHVSPVRLDTSVLKKTGGRGRPKKHFKRGRPRKYPLPLVEEQKQPKMWKPLGRPRKYPRVDPPEGSPAPEAPRRSRGRPRKLESKKGAHFRKYVPKSSSRNDGTPRKSGRPPSEAKEHEGPQRKRGRPKGSVNKNKAINESHDDRSFDEAEDFNTTQTESAPIESGDEMEETVQYSD